MDRERTFSPPGARRRPGPPARSGRLHRLDLPAGPPGAAAQPDARALDRDPAHGRGRPHAEPRLPERGRRRVEVPPDGGRDGGQGGGGAPPAHGRLPVRLQGQGREAQGHDRGGRVHLHADRAEGGVPGPREAHHGRRGRAADRAAHLPRRPPDRAQRAAGGVQAAHALGWRQGLRVPRRGRAPGDDGRRAGAGRAAGQAAAGDPQPAGEADAGGGHHDVHRRRHGEPGVRPADDRPLRAGLRRGPDHLPRARHRPGGAADLERDHAGSDGGRRHAPPEVPEARPLVPSRRVGSGGDRGGRRGAHPVARAQGAAGAAPAGGGRDHLQVRRGRAAGGTADAQGDHLHRHSAPARQGAGAHPHLRAHDGRGGPGDRPGQGHRVQQERGLRGRQAQGHRPEGVLRRRQGRAVPGRGAAAGGPRAGQRPDGAGHPDRHPHGQRSPPTSRSSTC